MTKDQITLNDFEPQVCECGNDAFAQYFKLYKLSALKSPTGREHFQSMPIYACASCFKVFNLAEEEKSVLE